MALSGTFDTMELPDLLQWIQVQRKTGTLVVMVDMEETELAFENGDLVAIGSADPLRLDIGQVLVAQKLITDQELAEAVRMAGPKGSVAQALLDEGAVGAEELERVRAEHALETVLDLFFHEEGAFRFTQSSGGARDEAGGEAEEPEKGEERPGRLSQPIPTKQILLDALSRLDEWHQITKVFPTCYVLVEPVGKRPKDLVLDELRAADSPISIAELCLRVGGSRFYVYRRLYEAHRAGLVRADGPPTPARGSNAQGPVATLLQNAKVLMAEDQYQEARMVISTALGLDPENPEARRLTRELRQRHLAHLRRQVPRERIPEMKASRGELKELDLSPKETYVACRVDGQMDVATLMVATPLGEMELLTILRKLHHAGLIDLK